MVVNGGIDVYFALRLTVFAKVSSQKGQQKRIAVLMLHVWLARPWINEGLTSSGIELHPNNAIMRPADRLRFKQERPGFQGILKLCREVFVILAAKPNRLARYFGRCCRFADYARFFKSREKSLYPRRRWSCYILFTA